jgi:N-acetylmuramoyl-L-alanine amidase
LTFIPYTLNCIFKIKTVNIKQIRCQGISAIMQRIKQTASTCSGPFLILLLLILAWPFSPAAQPPAPWKQPAGVIVIDPGHGGQDDGARGTSGALEKIICLELARKLADILDGSYKVILTRNGDYSLPNIQRSATANHHKADAFISLHAAAAFQHTAEGVTLYQYAPVGPLDSNPHKNTTLGNNPAKWRNIQIRHAASSSALAASLQDALATVTGPKQLRIQKAPLQVLAGADMPAVVIEIGYLTHPQTEKNLTSDTQLTAFARTIANGINVFMASAHKISSGN